MEDHPSSAVRDCLFNVFAAALHTGGSSSIRNLRMRHAMVTGTHITRWQGPTKHGDRDPQSTVTGNHKTRRQGPTKHGDRDPQNKVTGTHQTRWQGPAKHGKLVYIIIIIIIITNLLTPYSTVPLKKLTGFAGNQEIPRTLWNNPKVHYRTHKRVFCVSLLPRHGASPQVADGGTASDMEGSCEYIE
jgi:hypothetical protein